MSYKISCTLLKTVHISQGRKGCQASHVISCREVHHTVKNSGSAHKSLEFTRKSTKFSKEFHPHITSHPACISQIIAVRKPSTSFLWAIIFVMGNRTVQETEVLQQSSHSSLITGLECAVIYVTSHTFYGCISQPCTLS